MNYKEKYYKYKEKYLDLKQQKGGNEEIINVLWTSTKTLDVLPDELNIENLKDKDFNIFKLSFLNNYSACVIKKINSLIPEALNSNKFKTDLASLMNRNKISALYDSMVVFYMFSPEVQSFWKDLETKFQIKIKVFYGETEAIRRPVFQNTAGNFVNGLNILLSCNSYEHSKELNKKYNNIGKYFIGCQNFTHIYGSSIIKCVNGQKFLTKEFIESEEYRIIVGDGQPVEQLIKLMFYYFKKECEICRDCIFFDKDNICKKIENVIVKIKSNAKFEGKDTYFDARFSEKCKIESEKIECLEDSSFSDYIKNKLEEVDTVIDYTNKEYFK